MLHSADGGGKLVEPFLLGPRLSRPEIDADRPELRRARRLWRTAEHIGVPSDLEIHEPGGHDRGLKLRFQQSPGDSAFPQVDVTLGGVGNSFGHHDVTDLQPTAGLQHARHLE
jgi:hypothetical protein